MDNIGWERPKKISDCIYGFTYLAQLERERRALRVASLHVALQVDVEKLEHEVELLIRVDDVQQPVAKNKNRACPGSHQRERSECGVAHRTILSSLSSLRSEISRMAVLGTPSSSASSRIFLSATIWFVVTSFALYTTPYVPDRVHVRVRVAIRATAPHAARERREFSTEAFSRRTHLRL
jgi:hypothetical protein